MTPLWSLGVQQCRYSYYPESVVEEVVRQYREHDLPLDVIYLDIHYMNGYRVFKFDTSTFPDPKALTDKLSKQGVKTIVSADPGVKYQPPVTGAPAAHSSKPELQPQSLWGSVEGVEFYIRHLNRQSQAREPHKLRPAAKFRS